MQDARNSFVASEGRVKLLERVLYRLHWDHPDCRFDFKNQRSNTQEESANWEARDLVGRLKNS